MLRINFLIDKEINYSKSNVINGYRLRVKISIEVQIFSIENKHKTLKINEILRGVISIVCAKYLCLKLSRTTIVN